MNKLKDEKEQIQDITDRQSFQFQRTRETEDKYRDEIEKLRRDLDLYKEKGEKAAADMKRVQSEKDRLQEDLMRRSEVPVTSDRDVQIKERKSSFIFLT